MPIGFIQGDARRRIALEVMTSENPGPVFAFPARTIRIGRDEGNDVVLSDPEWRGVSRHHAEVRWDDNSWRLVDLGSLNGTYVNGNRVEDRRLQAGDEIRCGVHGPLLRVLLPELMVPTRAEPPNDSPARQR